MKMIFYLVFIFILALQSHAQWVQTNGPCGGYIYSLVVQDDSSGNGRRIFAGTEGGIYISTDDGASWKHADFWLWVNSIAVNDSFVLASTYNGLFRSSDNGLSWSLIGLGSPEYIRGFAVSGSNIFAASSGSVYISTNNGINWTLASSGLPEGGDVSTMVALGSNVFAGTWDHGIYLSTNNGTSWNTVNSGLPEMTKVYDFAVKGTDIFAGTMQGIFLSNNNGASWTRADSGIPRDQNGWSFISALAVSGKNIYASVSHIYYTNNRAIYLSTDNGASWKDVSPGLVWNPFYLSMAACGKYVFAVTIDRLYRTSDNGANWAKSDSGLINSSVSILFINGSDLYAGGEQGVHLSTDNGNSWSKEGLKFPSGTITSFALCGGRLFAGGGFNELFQNFPVVTLTDSNVWIKASSGMPDESFVTDLEVMGNTLFSAVSPRDSNSTSFIYLSKDGGVSWTKSSHNLPQINNLVTSGTDIFAATNQEILVSSDSGAHWASVFNPYYVNSFCISGSNMLVGSGGEFYHLIYDGKNWKIANKAYAPVDYITGFTSSGKSLLFGFSGGHVFLTTDYGKSWLDITSGLPANHFLVWNINYLAAGSEYLFAGTTMGVWRRPLSEIFSESVTAAKSSDEMPLKFSLEQNYPNPFNPSTTIKFSLPYPSHVTLKVYNLLGQETATLIKGEKSAGLHQEVWQADGIPSGIYFYEIKAGGFIQTRKMILLR